MNHLNSKDMKKLSMSLLLIGITNLGFAQYMLPAFGNPFHEAKSVVNVDNDYLNEVQKENTPNYAKWLEIKVANYDSSKSLTANQENKESYSVTFKAPLGYIEVEYDKSGNIKSTVEHFKNIPLPSYLSQDIIKLYPGWSFAQTKYVLKYTKGQKAKGQFKVVIKKGNQRKRLRVEA